MNIHSPFDIFLPVLIYPITNLLVAIYHVLFFLHIPSPLGFSLIVLTVFIRLLLYPIISTQLTTAKKMQRVAPLLSKVKEKHKGNTMMIQQETMRLYKEHGVNPALGCLPMAIQLPVIYALYNVLQHTVSLSGQKVVTEINKIVYTSNLKLTSAWDVQFFGMPLSQKPSELLHTVGPVVLLIPLLTGLFQLIQSKMMIGRQTTEVIVKETGKALKKPEITVKKEDDFATAFQSQSLFIIPFMIAFFSYSFPLGLSLYWNTFTIFGILQQYKVAGLGGLEDWIQKVKSVK